MIARQLLAAAFLFISTAFADDEIRVFDIPTIEKLGRAIHRQDQYAANATDFVFAELGGKAKFAEQNIRGYIVVGEEPNVIVRFVKAGADERIFPAYDVKFVKGPKAGTVSAAKESELSDEELAIWNARQLALRSMPRACSKNYNSVVLPDPDGEGLLVYMLAATDKPNLIPIGGHYRFTMAGDGTTIEKRDELFKSCLTFDTRSKDLPRGQELAAYYATNVVSDTPIEIHVFLNLSYGKPFYVGARDVSHWKIEKGSVSRSEKPSAARKSP